MTSSSSHFLSRFSLSRTKDRLLEARKFLNHRSVVIALLPLRFTEKRLNSIISLIMKILPALLPWLLVSCISAVLVASADSAKPIPYCAAPPIEFTDYKGEFWVQVVNLKPYPAGLREQLPYTPLYVDRDIDPVEGSHNGRADVRDIVSNEVGGGLPDDRALIDRVIVAGFDYTTDLFRIDNAYGYFLSNRNVARLWPDELTPDEIGRDIVTLYSGFNLLGFQISTGPEINPPSAPLLLFRIVKVCTPDGNTELQLRARNQAYLDGRMSSSLASHFNIETRLY